jgi:hypothetical protein
LPSKELVLRFVDIFRAVQQEADLGQRQHAHHQRVVPDLLVVDAVVDDVLQPALAGAGHLVHYPFRPGVQIGYPDRVRRVFVQAGQRQERRDGVDVLGRRALLQPVGEPAGDDLERPGVSRDLPVLQQAIKTDAVGPFPAGPALGVDDASIVQPQQEFARGVGDADKVLGQPVDQPGHLGTGNVAVLLPQQRVHVWYPPLAARPFFSERRFENQRTTIRFKMQDAGRRSRKSDQAHVMVISLWKVRRA